MITTLNDIQVNVIIIRKNNKNIYFRFDEEMNLVVTASKLVSEREIIKLIKKNEDSLYKMYLKVTKKQKREEIFTYLGKKYTIVYQNDVKQLSISDDFIFVKDEKMLSKFLNKECERVFFDRMRYWLDYFPDVPNFTLRYRQMKTRWGVNNRGSMSITLNSELIKKDVSLIDYVIVHELCHYYEPNHSKYFWAEVAKKYPNYKEARKALRG